MNDGMCHVFMLTWMHTRMVTWMDAKTLACFMFTAINTAHMHGIYGLQRKPKLVNDSGTQAGH